MRSRRSIIVATVHMRVVLYRAETPQNSMTVAAYILDARRLVVEPPSTTAATVPTELEAHRVKLENK